MSRLLGCLLPLLLSACAGPGLRELPPLPLLPPEDFQLAGQYSQRVEARFGDDRQTFLAAWAVGDETLDLVGLAPSGQRLLSLGYRNGAFTEDYSPLLERPLPGRRILAQLQLAHWPMSSVRRALAASPWRLEQGDGERRLYLDEQLILRIGAEYTAGPLERVPPAIRIRSTVSDYQLIVETLDVEGP